MNLRELEQLAADLHKKANASTGISGSEDKNEWLAGRIDQLIEEDSYHLADLLEESQNREQAIKYLEEQYKQYFHTAHENEEF